MRKRKVILLSTGLWLVVACGAPKTAITTPLDAATIAEASEIGAAFGLWATGRDWSQWAIGTAEIVACKGTQVPSGQYIEACTEIDSSAGPTVATETPISGSIVILSTLNHTDRVQALVHEMQHATVHADGHCEWSRNAALLSAIASPGGKGANFLDQCEHVECIFDNGVTCK